MQLTTYHYVYYTTVGSHTRRPRANPASAFAEIPGATEPAPMSLVVGSMFQASPAPETYPGVSGVTFQFAFMNVSGCVEGGRTSYDHAVPPPAGTVGRGNIDVWVIYVAIGGSGGNGGGGSGATIDAFDRTTGTLVNNTFVNVYNEDETLNASLTSSGNTNGYVDTTNSEIIKATEPITPAGINEIKGEFDQWQIFYGGSANTKVDLIEPTHLNVGQGEDSCSFAIYHSPSVLPCPYVIGGYHSPDIILIDPNTMNPVDVNSTPDPGSDSILTKNIPYIMQAVVHNDEDADAINTDVSFWKIPNGGCGPGPVLLSVERITLIPAHGSFTIESSARFICDNPAYTHNCAGVSVYNAISGCWNNATDGLGFYALATNPGNKSGAAWRNTDTIFGYPGQAFHIGAALGEYQQIFGPVPVEIQVQAQHVPVDWHNEGKAKEFSDILRNAGIKMNNPLYLLPDLKQTLKSVNLKTIISVSKSGKLIEEGKKSFIQFEKGKQTFFDVTGTIPNTAKKGDIFLVKITAQYPAFKRINAKAIEFLQVIHITDKKL